MASGALPRFPCLRNGCVRGQGVRRFASSGRGSGVAGPWAAGCPVAPPPSGPGFGGWVSWSVKPSPLVATGSSAGRARQDTWGGGLCVSRTASPFTGRVLTPLFGTATRCWPAFSRPLPPLPLLRTPPALSLEFSGGLSRRSGPCVGAAGSEGAQSVEKGFQTCSFIPWFSKYFFEHIWCPTLFSVMGNIEVNKIVLSLRCGRDGKTI